MTTRKEKIERLKAAARRDPKAAARIARTAAVVIVESSPGLPEHIKRELEGLDALKAALDDLHKGRR